MPPPLAACLFVGFIVWLFRRITKDSGPLPSALWIPFLWVTINATRPVVYWLSSGDAASEASDAAEGNPIDRNIYLVLTIIGCAILARRPVPWRNVLRNSKWLIVLYVYYLLSTTWSVEPFIAFKRWFKDTCDIVMVLLILTEADPVVAIRGLFIRCGYLWVPISVLFIKWYPTLGRYTHRYTYQTYYCGAGSNKNGLGVIAMLAGIFLIWQILYMQPVQIRFRNLPKLWPDLLVLAMCIWLLNLAGSSTATACFYLGAGILIVMRFDWLKSNIAAVRLSMLGLIIFMAVFTMSDNVRGAFATVLDRDVTLSDRTNIWHWVLELCENPIIGGGFASGWMNRSTQMTAYLDEYHVAHSHNGYLETYFHTGLIGVFLLVLVLISAGRNANFELMSGRIVGTLFGTLYCLILLFNYTEIAFSRSNVLGFLLILIAMYGPMSLVAHGLNTTPHLSKQIPPVS